MDFKTNVTTTGGDFYSPKPVTPQGVCPHCGYCPHCGRGGYHTYPYQPYPTYPWQPWIVYTNGTTNAL